MEGLQWPVGMVTPNPALTLMAASMKAFRCSALPMWQGRPLAVMPRRRRLVSVSSTFCCFLGVGWGVSAQCKGHGREDEGSAVSLGVSSRKRFLARIEDPMQLGKNEWMKLKGQYPASCMHPRP